MNPTIGTPLAFVRAKIAGKSPTSAEVLKTRESVNCQETRDPIIASTRVEATTAPAPSPIIAAKTTPKGAVDPTICSEGTIPAIRLVVTT